MAVLDPNQAVDPRYVQYTAATDDGRIYSGIVTNETATGLSLTDAQGQSVTVLRGNLEELQTQGRSLMPEGLERQITPTALADVLAYIKHAAQ